jgi:hypothetical protein
MSALHRNAIVVSEAALARGLTISVREFPDGTRTAQDAATAIGVELGQIVKQTTTPTLVSSWPSWPETINSTSEDSRLLPKQRRAGALMPKQFGPQLVSLSVAYPHLATQHNCKFSSTKRSFASTNCGLLRELPRWCFPFHQMPCWQQQERPSPILLASNVVEMSASRPPQPPKPVARSGVSALPSPLARAAALASVLIAGVCGALIGYAFFDVQSDGTTWPAIGLLLGGTIFAGGVAIVAVLALRASTEWREKVDPTAPDSRQRLG